ncbi:hypothetical protein Ccrd_014709 [Cynara cardunculus var. scolymus]|uniref:Uncharacterized protein n=1 Tax=Cynara cardunculus var. scolymus TaxID=59895 RepID=A0A103YD63_CYNCS|nr:hypothetical protein Ccrd_014709 [Cynara cardunculus var. scolymus]
MQQKDVGRSEKRISEHPMGIKDQCLAEKFSVNNGSSLAVPILRCAFGYAKFTSDMNSMPSHTKNLQIHTNDIYDEKKVVDGYSVLGSSLQIRNGATIVSKCLGSLPLAPPTYLVCLDSLKGDSHPYKYLVAQTVEQRWQKYFCASLVVSSSILGDLHSDDPISAWP